jgi:hypothetical protein
VEVPARLNQRRQDWALKLSQRLSKLIFSPVTAGELRNPQGDTGSEIVGMAIRLWG